MSLITVEASRSGHPILKKDGRFLDSSFDPVKDATIWAERVAREAGDAESVFVLGVGTGYHIEALKVLLPSRMIVAIDCDSAVVSEATRINSALRSLSVVCETEWHRLIEHAAFRDGLGGRYAIAKHGPSCQIQMTYFHAVERLLIGREKIAFLLQLKTRPELYALFDPAAIEAMGPDLVSIKTLQNLFSESSANRRERRLWKVLEELIA